MEDEVVQEQIKLFFVGWAHEMLPIFRVGDEYVDILSVYSQSGRFNNGEHQPTVWGPHFPYQPHASNRNSHIQILSHIVDRAW